MAKEQFNHALTKPEIEEIRSDALVFYYPEIVGEASRPADPGPHATKSFSWTDRNDFARDISFLTQVDVTKAQGEKLYPLLKTIDKNLTGLAGSNPVTGTRPTKEQLETSIAEAEKKETERQKIIKESNAAVRRTIAKQQEIHDKLAATKPKIYVKTTAPQALQLSGNAQAVLNDLKTNPSIPNITQQLEKSITSSLESQLSKEQIHLIALDAAYKAVDAANNPGKYTQTAVQSAILNAVAKDKDVIPKLITDSDILAGIQSGANELSVFQNLQTNSARMVWGAFDPAVGKTLFPDPGDYHIDLSETQLPGYETTFSPDGMVQGYTSFLTNNLEFFGKLAGLPVDKFRQEILGNATSWIERQISINFPQAAKFFATPESQLILSSLGVGTTTVELTGSFASFFVENPATLPVLNFFGSGFGINFSIGSITGTVAAQTATVATAQSIATTGGIMASEAFLGGAGGAAAGAAVGQAAIPVPIVGAVIGAVAGVVGPKVINFIKDNAKKIGIIGIGLIGGAFGFILGGGSILTALLGGGLAYGGAAVLSGGLPALGAAVSSAASAAGSAISFVWSTFLAGIGMPILVTLLVFPVVVALILFIINSGAYIVPPSPSSLTSGTVIVSPYIDVSKVANPSGPFQNSDLPLTVEYQITVKAKKNPLTNVRIGYECGVTKRVASAICPPADPSVPSGIEIPDTISPSSEFTFSYKQTYDKLNYQDSLITDTITITADSPEQRGAVAASSAGVKIGNPPDNCPSGWPNTGVRTITQTPGGSYSHSSVEAVDIGDMPIGTPVRATHSGIANVIRATNAYRPMYITITSNCGGKNFATWYAHLSSSAVSDGQQITMGQTIGASGSAGSGPHLHYEFRGLPMTKPYIPADQFIRNCSDDAGKCGFTR